MPDLLWRRPDTEGLLVGTISAGLLTPAGGDGRATGAAPALLADPARLFAAAGMAADPWQVRLLEWALRFGDAPAGEPPGSGSTQALVLAARQLGKSQVAAACAVLTALCKPPDPATGRPPLVLIISAAQRQSAEVLRKAKVLLSALANGEGGAGDRYPGEPARVRHPFRPRRLRREVEYYEALLGRGMVPGDDGVDGAATGGEVVSDRELSVELANGARVVCLPAKAATSVGYTTDLLIYDEAAHIPEAVYYLMRATRSRSHGKLMLLSSPFGKRGFFWEAFQACEAALARGAPEPWFRTRVTALDEPRRLTDEFLAAERADIGERWFGQEYMTEFRDPVDAVFARDEIDAALDDGVVPLF